MVNDAVLEYILKRTESKGRIKINHGNKKSQLDYQIKLLSRRNIFKLLFMFGYFLGVTLCKFNVLHNSSSSQHRPHYSFKCNIESNYFTQMYSFETSHISRIEDSC